MPRSMREEMDNEWNREHQGAQRQRDGELKAAADQGYRITRLGMLAWVHCPDCKRGHINKQHAKSCCSEDKMSGVPAEERAFIT